jgi:hypothetical protein
MKISSALRICLWLLIFCVFANARAAALRYKFSAGQTNAFAVEISVRSETGSEITSGNVIFVTKEVTTNSVKLSCRGSLKSEIKRTPQRGPGFYPGHYPGNMMQNMNVFPNDCEIELDERGNELRDAGDYVLAVPLGKLVQSIFEPLPAKSGSEETSDAVSVLDEPFWLGPAENFINVRMNGQPIYMNYMGFNSRQSPATLTLSRHTKLRVKASTADTVELHKQTTFESFLKTENEPRFAATSETDFVFDRTAGLFAKIETQSDVSSQTETTSRKAKVSFKCRLLTGAELAAVLAPPPPIPPRKLSGADSEKIVADLTSPELETRRAAMRQFNGVEVESPSAELLDLVATMATDSDTFVRMTAANFLGNYGTTNQVPVLLKLLKDSDWSSRQPAVKALGKLKDERAIQPLADLVARGSQFNQDASAALINIGTPAEKAVLGLLNERNAETQRQACNILQQIGTSESLDALQKLVSDSDQSVSQAAVDAIRNIKMRQ